MISLRQIVRLSFSVSILCAAAVSGAVTPESIRVDIDTILSRPGVAGNTWSILIKDQLGTATYYDRTPTTVLKPASNTKMFTVAAAFGRLGTQYRFPTRVYRTATVSSTGQLVGDLILIGEHDFTWSSNYYATSRTPLDQIAQQLYNAGLRSVSGNIIAKGYCVYAGVASNADTALAFKDALVAKGITVKAKTSGQTGFAVTGTLFTSWNSMPLEQVCRHLMKVSHNLYADTLCRHLGYKINGTDSLAAGCSVITGWLTSVGLNTTGMLLYDGSGLSHSNRINANQIDQLVRYMIHNYPSWDDTLAIGCVDGTISGRFCGTPGAGNVFAKTGTLTGVNALSGYIFNASDSQVYLFSILANNVMDEAATLQAIDDTVLVMSQAGISNSVVQVIVDNDTPSYSEAGTWAYSTGTGYYGTQSRYSTGGTGADTATWRPDLPSAGTYDVYAWWVPGTNRATNAPFLVQHATGSTTVLANQSTGASSWNFLGTFTFSAGTGGSVTLSDAVAGDKVVSSDAVRFVLRP